MSKILKKANVTYKKDTKIEAKPLRNSDTPTELMKMDIMVG